MKKKLLIYALLFGSGTTMAQNCDMNISAQNLSGPIRLGDTAIIKISIKNTGTPSLRSNSLYVNVTAPSNGRIAGIVPDSSTAHFTVHSLGNQATANAITLTNTGGAIDPAPTGATAYIYLYMVGAVIDGPKSFNAQVAFNPFNGPDSLASYQAQGNTQVGNDNQTSSLSVTVPLPLQFLTVAAAWQGADALVTWSVADEKNNDYFTVERSVDGKIFAAAGKVKSKGNHTGNSDYSFTDLRAKATGATTLYYRIRQQDIDGKQTLSTIVVLKQSGRENQAFLYPNPATGNTVKFVYENNTLGKDAPMSLQLVDMQGRIVLQQQMILASGHNELPCNLAALAPGSYYFIYRNDRDKIKGSFKLVKN